MSHMNMKTEKKSYLGNIQWVLFYIELLCLYFVDKNRDADLNAGVTVAVSPASLIPPQIPPTAFVQSRGKFCANVNRMLQ